MNGQQIVSCAEAIVNDKWMLKLDDIDLCLRNVLAGNYGDIFNRMDRPTIFSFLSKFEKERDIAIARKRDKDVEANNIYTLFQNPQMNEILKEVTDKLVHTEKPMDMKIVKLSPFEKMVQDEWDRLPMSSVTPRFRIYGHVDFDFTQYRYIRAEEEVLKHGAHDTNEIPPLTL
jgi:hypothetical protein